MADTKSNENDKKESNPLTKTNSSASRRPSVALSRPQKPQPLDGGWGWFVVLGGALGHFLLVGLARTLGVFFVDWIDRFEGSAADTVLVQSLFNTTRMVTGPLVGMLCDAVGCRKVVMAGGFVFSIACLISAFATNLVFLYLTFSLIGGIGAACIFTPMFIMVNHYFEMKKGIAMALCTMGSGLGTLALAPLWTYLLQEFGHYGTMFIVSGLMMNTVVVGALFRPLKSKLNWPPQRRRPKELKVIVGADENDGESNTQGEDDVQESIAINEQQENAKLSPHSATEEKLKNASNHSLQSSESKVLKASSDSISLLQNKEEDETSMKRVPSNASNTGMKIVSSQLQHSNDATVKESKCDILKKRYAFLKSITFWFYSFYMAALPAAVQIYVIYIPSLVQEMGFSKTQSALVLSISGGADIGGRFLAGFLFDLGLVRKRRWPTHCLYGISLGIVIFLNAIQRTLVGFIAMGLLWGLFEGGYHSQRATIVSEFISRDQIASSVGFMIFWQGIGNMVSPTFAGFLKDKTGTYTVCFYYGGAAMTLCATMFFINFLVVHFKRKRDQKANQQQENIKA